MRRLALLLAIAGLVACGSARLSSGDVARVGGVVVERPRLDALIRSARVYYSERRKRFPAAGTPGYRRLRDETVRRLVQGAIFVDAARRRGLGVSDRDVDAAIELLKAEQYDGSEGRLRAAIGDAGLTFPEFREEERVQLSESAVQDDVLAKVTVRDAEARAYFRAHRADYRTAASRPVRHILVETKALADALYRRLRGGASFESLMHQYSTDTASRSGTGAMTDTRGLFVPPFEKVAFGLRRREISRPVRTQYGWDLIQALGPVRPAAPKSYAAVADSIKAILLAPKQQRALKSFTDGLYRDYCDGRIEYGKGYSSTFCASRSSRSPS